jgi:adenylate cyclase
MTDFGNYRRDLAVLETGGGRAIPQIQHNPPTALGSPNPVAPWMATNGSPALSSPGFGTSFYDDSSDNLSQGSQLSPGFRPGTGLTRDTNASESPADANFGDERRPSVASVTTASSTGSKSSVSRQGGIHKKLQTFFGDDFTGKDGSDTSLPSQAKETRTHSFARNHRDRNNSNAAAQRENSPVPSRPRTPVPSSDVVPFLYQDSQVRFFLMRRLEFSNRSGSAHHFVRSTITIDNLMTEAETKQGSQLTSTSGHFTIRRSSSSREAVWAR